MTPVNEAVPGKLYRVDFFDLDKEESQVITELYGQVAMFLSFTKIPRRMEYGVMKFLHEGHIVSFKHMTSRVCLEEFTEEESQ
jgi:glycerol-3-phosphate cytidylyltransferase-like family protein